MGQGSGGLSLELGVLSSSSLPPWEAALDLAAVIPPPTTALSKAPVEFSYKDISEVLADENGTPMTGKHNDLQVHA
ncbi:hypothetical protein ABKV19_010973 [Rosa sericea]